MLSILDISAFHFGSSKSPFAGAFRPNRHKAIALSRVVSDEAQITEAFVVYPTVEHHF